MFRDRESIMAAKRSKQDWSNTWYLKNDTIGTVSCPVTPGATLKKSLNHEINKDRDTKLLIVEDGGRPIHVGLKSRDPSRPEGCLFGDANCFMTGLQNQIVENWAVRPFLSKKDIVELNMGKGYFARKWVSKQNWKGDT